jgi:hypothetical protein
MGKVFAAIERGAQSEWGLISPLHPQWLPMGNERPPADRHALAVAISAQHGVVCAGITSVRDGNRHRAH